MIFGIPGCDEMIQCEGRVVRESKDESGIKHEIRGMGVEFIAPSPKMVRLIDEYVDRTIYKQKSGEEVASNSAKP
jgi:hypothetical protein